MFVLCVYTAFNSHKLRCVCVSICRAKRERGKCHKTVDGGGKPSRSEEHDHAYRCLLLFEPWWTHSISLSLGSFLLLHRSSLILLARSSSFFYDSILSIYVYEHTGLLDWCRLRFETQARHSYSQRSCCKVTKAATEKSAGRNHKDWRDTEPSSSVFTCSVMQTSQKINVERGDK